MERKQSSLHRTGLGVNTLIAVTGTAASLHAAYSGHLIPALVTGVIGGIFARKCWKQFQDTKNEGT